MDLGEVDKSVPRLRVELLLKHKTRIYVGGQIPAHCYIGTTPSIIPLLLMAGSPEPGYAVWLLSRAILIDQREYLLRDGYGLLAKFNHMGISPLLQVATPEIHKLTLHTVWPIARRMPEEFTKMNKLWSAL